MHPLDIAAATPSPFAEQIGEEEAVGLRNAAVQQSARENPFLSTLGGTLTGTVGGGSLTAAGNVAGAMGLRKASDALYAKGKQLQTEAAPYMAPQLDYSTVQDVGSAWDFARANAAQGAGSMLPMIAGRYLGGHGLGLAAGVAPQLGENVSRIKDDPRLAGMTEGQILGAAAPTAALQTGLDYLVPGGVATNLARKAATRIGTGAAGRAGATIGTNMLLEGGAELGQEELGMGMHSLLNPTRDTTGDEHARIQSFLGGAVGGAPVGMIDAGVGYAQDKVSAKPLDISQESDAILKSRKPLHPNLTDAEMGEALTQRDAQESAQAEQLAQRAKAESTSPRVQKLADEYLAGDKSGPAAEAFVREVQRADKTEKAVETAKEWGRGARAWLNEKIGGRLGSAQYEPINEAQIASGVRSVPDAYGNVGTPMEEAIIDNLMLAYRSSDIKKRAEAQAEAAMQINDVAEPLNKWIELNFGADFNDGEVVVPPQMLKLSDKLDVFVKTLYENKVRRGEPVPAPEMLQAVISKINELEAAPKYEQQAAKKETYDEENVDDIGTNAIEPNILGTRKVYYGKSDKKEVPFKVGEEDAMRARAEGLAGSGMKTKPVGAWQRLKNAYPSDDVELYKKEDQLLATHAKDAWAGLEKFKSQAATEEGRQKEYNTQRRLALETLDREVQFLEAEDAAPAERSEVRGEDFRTIKPKSPNNRWAVQTEGVKTGKFYGGPEHGAVWFKRASDGVEFATSVSKLIKLGRQADNVSGKKGVEEQKQALLAGISSFLNAKETNGEPALMGFGFKSEPKGKVELTDKLPANLKLHSGTFGDKVFTPQAQGAFDKYFRAAEKVDAAKIAHERVGKAEKWGAAQRLARAKEELAVQERELRKGTVLSVKAENLIEKAEREGYAEEAQEIREAVDTLEKAVGDATSMDAARVALNDKINDLYDFLGRVGIDQDNKEVASDTQMMGAKGISRSLEEDFTNPNKAVADRDESGEVARKAPEGSLAVSQMKVEAPRQSDPVTSKINWYAKTLLNKGVNAMVSAARRQEGARYGEMYRMLTRVAGLDKDDPLWGKEAWKERDVDRKQASKLALQAVNQLEKPSEKRLSNAMTPAEKREVVTEVPIPKEVLEGIKLILSGKPLPDGLRFAYKDTELRIRSEDELAELEPKERQRAKNANTATVNLLNHLTKSNALEFIPWAKKVGLDPNSDEARMKYYPDRVNHVQPPELNLESGMMRVVTTSSENDKKLLGNAQSSAEIPTGDETLTDGQKAEIRAAVTKRLGEMNLTLSKALFGMVGGKQVPLSADWAPDSIRIAANIGFKSAMQASMHEGMHEFFHRLSQEPAGKAMLDKLLAAANSASVVRQLERLLENHPNALMQIKKGEPDFENERLAYMYQFWQAGALELGPETKTIFHRVMTYLRELTKLLSNDQQAELILQAFDDGKFSDKAKTSVVAKVMLADINSRNALIEKAKVLAEGPIERLRKVAVSAHSTLYDSGYDDLKDIANFFWLKPGDRNTDGSQGVFEARKQKSSEFLNKMNQILMKLGPKDVEAVRDALLREDGVAPKDMAQFAAYTQIRELLDKVHVYFDEAGVKRLVEGMGPGARKEWEKIPKRKNYFPVVWNVMGQEGDFVADLMKYHQREIMERLQALGFDDYKETSKHLEYAQAIASRLNNTQGDPALAETTTSLGFSPIMSAVNERSLDWIVAPEMTKYRSQDLVETMTSYIMQAVKRAEYVRQAGNGGVNIKTRVMNAYVKMLEKRIWAAGGTDADKLAQKMMGTYKDEYLSEGREPSAKKYKAEDFGMTETQLEEIKTDALKEISKYHKAIMALEGTLGHDISPTLRKLSGAAMVFQNFRLLIPTLFSSVSDPMGIVVNGGEIDDAFDALKRGLKGVYKTWTQDYDTDPETELAELQGWVDAGSFMETMGQTYSSLYMAGNVKRLNDGLFKWNGMEAWNKGMRVGASIAAQKFIVKHLTKPTKHSERYLKELFGEYRPELVDGKLNVNDPKVTQAVMRWVDGAILSPNAAQRPVWASDPHWALLFHMKQFTYSFHKVILKKAWDEGVIHGNAGPMLTLIAGYTPLVIAGDALRAIIMSGGEEPYWMQKGVGSTLMHGIERANLSGIPQLGLDAFAKTKNSKEGIFDATLEGAASLAGPTTSWAKDWYDKPVGEQMLRSLPLGSTWAKFSEEAPAEK